MDFEDVVVSAAEKKQPHIICNYVYEVATMFHSYYGSHKIITDNEQYTNQINNSLYIQQIYNNK